MLLIFEERKKNIDGTLQAYNICSEESIYSYKSMWNTDKNTFCKQIWSTLNALSFTIRVGLGYYRNKKSDEKA